MGSWIRDSNFVLFVVNGLIKGEIEKPSGQYLGLICDESLTCRGLNLNPGHFRGSILPSCSCRESSLLASWCVGGRCDMAGKDEDHGRSRRPSAEDR
jgi:energy-converting hydrogenase Eha subunit B